MLRFFLALLLTMIIVRVSIGNTLLQHAVSFVICLHNTTGFTARSSILILLIQRKNTEQ